MVCPLDQQAARQQDVEPTQLRSWPDGSGAAPGWADGVGNGDGNGDDERRMRKKSDLLYEGFFKLGVLLTVVLVCFAQGIGTYL